MAMASRPPILRPVARVLRARARVLLGQGSRGRQGDHEEGRHDQVSDRRINSGSPVRPHADRFDVLESHFVILSDHGIESDVHDLEGGHISPPGDDTAMSWS